MIEHLGEGLDENSVCVNTELRVSRVRRFAINMDISNSDALVTNS
jgi:hypothetical protein